MTKEKYSKRLYKINENKNNLIKKLDKKYAYENNPFKIGDIIEDDFDVIKIEKISISLIDDYPQCVYHGENIKTKKQANVLQEYARKVNP